MDISSAAITVALGLFSGVLGAALFIWRVSAGYHTTKTATEARLTSLENKDKELKKDLDDLTSETQEHADQQGIQWQEINRSLGQIEGALGINQPHPPPRRTRP